MLLVLIKNYHNFRKVGVVAGININSSITMILGNLAAANPWNLGIRIWLMIGLGCSSKCRMDPMLIKANLGVGKIRRRISMIQIISIRMNNLLGEDHLMRWNFHHLQNLMDRIRSLERASRAVLEHLGHLFQGHRKFGIKDDNIFY